MRRQFSDPHGNTDGNLDERIAAITCVTTHGAANAVGDLHCRFNVDLRQQNSKLVTSVSYKHIARPEMLEQDV